jgi:hypothetical protein
MVAVAVASIGVAGHVLFTVFESEKEELRLKGLASAYGIVRCCEGICGLVLEAMVIGLPVSGGIGHDSHWAFLDAGSPCRRMLEIATR